MKDLLPFLTWCSRWPRLQHTHQHLPKNKMISFRKAKVKWFHTLQPKCIQSSLHDQSINQSINQPIKLLTWYSQRPESILAAQWMLLYLIFHTFVRHRTIYSFIWKQNDTADNEYIVFFLSKTMSILYSFYLKQWVYCILFHLKTMRTLYGQWVNCILFIWKQWVYCILFYLKTMRTLYGQSVYCSCKHIM